MRKPVTPVTPVTPRQHRRKLKRHSMEIERRDSWRAMHNAGVVLSGVREAMGGGAGWAAGVLGVRRGEDSALAGLQREQPGCRCAREGALVACGCA